ncbi:MAG TPA: alpha/beta hydrolase [Flavisolibacter sp.]|nr:alpha/beta hydrolase [Flavisolibacter sp.]
MVYQSHNQASLDNQYNNRLHVPNFQDYLDRWELWSRETERSLPVTKDMAYGNLPGERLDVYPSPHRHSKTLVFIHGGWWHLLDKALFHFLAAGFRPYGITTVLLTYPQAPKHSMDQIVGSCRKAVPWLYRHIADFNGDPEQLYVAGHSAGGHLTAMLAATDWKQGHSDVPEGVLKGACFVSGLFNLVPIQLSYLNTVLQMDKEMAVRNSPAGLEPFATCHLIVAVGEAETTAFRDQSNEFFSAWKDKHHAIQFLPLPGLNHFSVVEAIRDPDAALHQAICRLMGLRGAYPR